MSSNLKVEFIDNASSQYDANADWIKVESIKSKGKLYLGDRYSASYIQLKFRNCKTVVNCCTDTHGLARETDVKYLKIDPTTGDNCFAESFEYIDTNLDNGKNVVVHCENGLGKSAVIVLYYLMKKKSIDLAESYRYLKKYRKGLKLPPSLLTIIMEAEKSLRGSSSVMYDKNARKIVFLDELGFTNRNKTTKNVSNKSNIVYYIVFGLGVFFAVVFGTIYLITGKI